tara:strand:+ start:110 stop:232 length:123 start_codon:yes stop_codon:yes gene_type:complete
VNDGEATEDEADDDDEEEFAVEEESISQEYFNVDEGCVDA